MATTPRWGLRYPQGPDVPDVALWMSRLATDLDGVAMDDQGTLAARPVSTVQNPGKRGRSYYATDTGQLFRDHGTGWTEVALTEQMAATLGLTSSTGTRRGKSIIATQQQAPGASFTGLAAYGLLATPDRVSGITLPTDGLIFVAFQAQWGVMASTVFAGDEYMEVGAFLGATQITRHTGAAATPSPMTAQLPILNGESKWNALASTPSGFATINPARTPGNTPNVTGDVTTGQAIGAEMGGGFFAVFAAAGTYDVSIRFRTYNAEGYVRNRKLWVWTAGF